MSILSQISGVSLEDKLTALEAAGIEVRKVYTAYVPYDVHDLFSPHQRAICKKQMTIDEAYNMLIGLERMSKDPFE